MAAARFRNPLRHRRTLGGYLGASGAIGLVALLLVGALPIAESAGASSSRTTRASALLAPPVRMGHLSVPGRVHPLQSGEWYTQEGTTLAAVDGSTTYSPPSLVENVTLVTSPYSTAYELNALSNSGDWYQIVAADNWPGCNSGFEEGLEVWDASGGSGPLICDSTLSLSAGDAIQFEIAVVANGSVCLTLTDVTTGLSHPACQSQPDSGATGFALLDSTSDSNGYYTGPMTETINLTGTGCPDYSNLPRISYDYPAPFYVTSYIPWSDEFDAFGSGCYVGGGSVDTISSGSPAVQFVDTAFGTGYGPRWGAGENASYVLPGIAFQYQTDPVPITGAQLAVTSTLLSVGGNTTYYVNGSGGVSPYRAILAVNGSAGRVGPDPGSFVPRGTGMYSLSGYLVDSQNDAYGPTAAVMIDVPGMLTVGLVASTPISGAADVAQNVTFTARVNGGIPPLMYFWSGLPSGCTPADLPTIRCAPDQTGNSTVALTVDDSNDSSVAATPLAYRVYSDPVVIVTPSSAEIDLGQTATFTAAVSGGTGIYTLAWEGGPSGCAAGSILQLVCKPNATGTTGLRLVATDSNQYSVESAPVALTVNPAPSVELFAGRVALDEGANLSLTTVVQGGSAPFEYSWSGLPSGCLSRNASTLSCTVGETGSFTVGVSVRDATGLVVTPASVSIAVFNPLSMSLLVTPKTSTVGSSVTFQAEVGGGLPPPIVAWAGLPAGCNPTNGSLTVICTPEEAGSYNVSVRATDSSGGDASAFVILTVQGPASGGTGEFAGLAWWVWAAVTAVVALAAIGGMLVVRRRRRD